MSPWELFFFVWIFIPAIPAYVVARRLGIPNAAVAFVPFVGATIVILWSVRRSGWMVLLSIIPLVGLIFGIWLVCIVPAEHGRNVWWRLPFLIPVVQLAAFYVYAFTQPDRRSGAVLARPA
jgi:uncharacterized membrane protein